MSSEVIVITGPESSGKTTLAEQLATYWKVPLVAEFAREYLTEKESYHQEDLLEIAKQQNEDEQTMSSQPVKRIVCDTDLLVILIWSEVKYGYCDPWIIDTFKRAIHKPGFHRKYFLCDYKIPWQDDPLRENPNNRGELYERYLEKLKDYELDYQIVKGDPQQRLRQAVEGVS